MSTNEYLISGVREHAKDRGWYPSRQECIDLADALEDVTAERDELDAVLHELGERHKPREHRALDGINLGGEVCDSCRRPWPCDVGRALNAAPSVALDRVRAEAVRSARDSIMPPYNCELRPDGSEDPGMAEYVGIMHEVHDRLTDHADRIEKGESTD